ncbi:MAG: four-carbon acid sugar kinase family protein [Pedobacter sp.]|nr:MAG: four-carbon acid sugar kinase family protein [Pedobacter sp.]
MNGEKLKIAYYGDDFTGSTDALEFLNKSGIKTVLFIDVPNQAQISRYPGLQAIGIAGKSRTQSPSEMEETLFPVFEALKALQPEHVHYKVCSTFDSSPSIGSIGKAIDIGMEVFASRILPLLVAAPVLGRYCLFGNLFARMGIGSDGAIYRLDRHPSMSKHPVTPANESDLSLHLAQQTNKNIRLFSILELHQYRDHQKPLSFNEGEIVLFDALEQKELALIGEIIDQQVKENNPVFSVGSSGVEMALGAHWNLDNEFTWDLKPLTEPIIVLSGSCSAVTSAQINYALNNGFVGIAIDTLSLASEVSVKGLTVTDDVVEAYAAQALGLLQQGKHVLIHTSLGNDDPRVNATDEVLEQNAVKKGETASLYGTLLGEIARKVVAKIAIQRIVVAGGDTSSYAARAMGIEAVEMIAPLSPGAPICKAYAPNSAIDTLELVFKGGQVGKEDFFLSASN